METTSKAIHSETLSKAVENSLSPVEVLEFPPKSLAGNMLNGGIFLAKSRRLIRAEVWDDRFDLYFDDKTIESLKSGTFTATRFEDNKGTILTIASGGRSFKIWGHVVGDEDKFNRLVGMLGAGKWRE